MLSFKTLEILPLKHKDFKTPAAKEIDALLQNNNSQADLEIVEDVDSSSWKHSKAFSFNPNIITYYDKIATNINLQDSETLTLENQYFWLIKGL